MEKPNQFLEENAKIYDTETNNEETSEDIVYVYSGDAMDMEDVFHFSCIENIEPIIVAGERESGKTTLEVMMYRLFLEGKNERFHFAGSRTMKGFRERSEKILKKSGAEEPKVPRTPRADKKFLHLAVCENNGKCEHLVLADYAGEMFDEPSNLQELGEFFAGISNVVITLDGEKICSYKNRSVVISHTNILLTRMQNARILSQNTHLYIVCTKFDKIKESGNKDSAIGFLEERYAKLKEKFEKTVGKMELIYLCAYGIGEREERDKMETLLSSFIERSEKQSMCSPKEQIDVKRQMDKFKVRG